MSLYKYTDLAIGYSQYKSGHLIYSMWLINNNLYYCLILITAKPIRNNHTKRYWTGQHRNSSLKLCSIVYGMIICYPLFNDKIYLIAINIII